MSRVACCCSRISKAMHAGEGSEKVPLAGPVAGMMCIAHGDTLIARDGEREIRTPHDDCVLIMPTRRPRKGETAVRLGRFAT